MDADINAKILLSALAADAMPQSSAGAVVLNLKKFASDNQVNVQEIARSFHKPRLLRRLQISEGNSVGVLQSIDLSGSSVVYGSHPVGQIKILFKASLPNELQARLTVESAIERFLDYLLKVHQIVVLDESDRHVRVFVPGRKAYDIQTLWESFIKNIAFSAYGDTRLQMPGLVQTFIAMLNSITLSGRGFSILDIPVLTKDQADVLAAWYFAVVQQVWQRQVTRQTQINSLQNESASLEITDKERQSRQKEIDDKEAMQTKEATKYKDSFEKSFGKFLDEQLNFWEEIKQIDVQLDNASTSTKDAKKLRRKRNKAQSGITTSEAFLTEKRALFKEVDCDPFKLVFTDTERSPEKFKSITELAKRFQKKATEQINSTRGDIFTQCIAEMYRLLNWEDNFDPCPPSLLSETPLEPSFRLPGDDSKEFCYACGTGLDPKAARWKVVRFMFERPSQRRQSSSGEGRPYICASCSALSFASPLKVTDESIVLRLEPKDRRFVSSLSTQDYVRMISNKEAHLSGGKYVIITSDRTNTGELASSKLGQVQYAMAKVASIFPQAVLADFRFRVVLQGSDVELPSRHLLFIKGLMDAYGQSIITAGKEINMSLGSAIRYIQQDLPYLADYSLVKTSSVINQRLLEKTRTIYWQEVKGSMNSTSEPAPRARLYRDVAALTGLNYAFIESLERTAKKSLEQKKDPKYAAREVSKIIEKTDGPYVFGYYATLGGEEKKDVQARLYQNAENAFISSQLLDLLEKLGIHERESKDGDYIQLHIDDLQRAYEHFANQPPYSHEKGWKDLTYNLKLSLYTRFPELVRKLKPTDEK